MHVFTLTLSNFKKIMLVTEYEVYYNSWVKSIRKALGYSNLNDHYSFVKPKKILGEGQFGEVRLAIHIKSNQKVAIYEERMKSVSTKQLIIAVGGITAGYLPSLVKNWGLFALCAIVSLTCLLVGFLKNKNYELKN